MAMFNSYVKLPEGIRMIRLQNQQILAKLQLCQSESSGLQSHRRATMNHGLIFRNRYGFYKASTYGWSLYRHYFVIFMWEKIVQNQLVSCGIPVDKMCLRAVVRCWTAWYIRWRHCATECHTLGVHVWGAFNLIEIPFSNCFSNWKGSQKVQHRIPTMVIYLSFWIFLVASQCREARHEWFSSPWPSRHW